MILVFVILPRENRFCSIEKLQKKQMNETMQNSTTDCDKKELVMGMTAGTR